jgi:hypothetical protein
MMKPIRARWFAMALLDSRVTVQLCGFGALANRDTRWLIERFRVFIYKLYEYANELVSRDPIGPIANDDFLVRIVRPSQVTIHRVLHPAYVCVAVIPLGGGFLIMCRRNVKVALLFLGSSGFWQRIVGGKRVASKQQNSETQTRFHGCNLFSAGNCNGWPLIGQAAL